MLICPLNTWECLQLIYSNTFHSNSGILYLSCSLNYSGFLPSFTLRMTGLFLLLVMSLEDELLCYCEQSSCLLVVAASL